jgi:hypothetical protein
VSGRRARPMPAAFAVFAVFAARAVRAVLAVFAVFAARAVLAVFAVFAVRAVRAALAVRTARTAMTAFVTATAFAAAAFAASPAAAEPLPRVAHIERALAAVRALGPAGRDALDRTLYEATRTQCRGDGGAPDASCLIAAARAACAADPDRARCEAAADVIAANLRATNAWVDEPTRIRLVRGSTDYRAALAVELRRRYAALASELVVGPEAARPGGSGDGALPRAIDLLCARRDRAVHACEPGDAACVPSLPWSRCAAALVWFIGGSP